MTEVCNMKQVFSCSDFLNDLWQNNPEAPDSLPGLPSEGGSTQLGREKSTDMFNLLSVAEDTDAISNPFGPFTATSTSQRDPAGNKYRPLASIVLWRLDADMQQTAYRSTSVDASLLRVSQAFLACQASTVTLVFSLVSCQQTRACCKTALCTSQLHPLSHELLMVKNFSLRPNGLVSLKR